MVRAEKSQTLINQNLASEEGDEKLLKQVITTVPTNPICHSLY